MWESRVLGEISKRLWESFCDFHRRAISIAAARPPSPDPPAVPGRREPPRLAINTAQFHVHEPRGPIAPRGFGQANQFAANRLADKDQVALPADLACLFDPTHLVRRVVPGVREPLRVGPG